MASSEILFMTQFVIRYICSGKKKNHHHHTAKTKNQTPPSFFDSNIHMIPML